MQNKFDAKTWFIEDEDALNMDPNKKGIHNLLHSCPFCHRQFMAAFDDDECPYCGKNTNIIDKKDANKKLFHASNVLEPFHHLIACESKITPKMANAFAKQLNPSLYTMRLLYGIMSIITFALGAAFLFIGVPVVILISVGFLFKFFSASNKISVLKQTITALKTPEKFELYCNRAHCAKYNEFTFRHDECAVYNTDNAIFSIDNVCLIYTVGKKVYFGTIKGTFIQFGQSLAEAQQKALIHVLKSANPNILIGLQHIEDVKRLLGT